MFVMTTAVFFSFMQEGESMRVRMFTPLPGPGPGPGPATAWRADGWHVILLSPPGYCGLERGLLFPSLISEPC